MGKRTPAEFHYVEWHFRRWLGSETRARCQAVGGLLGCATKGAYRDLLDFCYDGGSIPADLPGLAAICGLAVEDMEKIWPTIRGKFQVHKKDSSRLVNNEVETRRREFKRTQKINSHAGRKSAEKRGSLSGKEINELGNDRSTGVQRPFNQKRNEEQRSETKRRETNGTRGALAGDNEPTLPIAQALRPYGANPDAVICRRILQAAIGVDSKITAEMVALIIPVSITEGYRVDGPALFERTVPAFMNGTDWQWLRTFPERGREAIPDARGILRDRKAPERVMRFLRAWLMAIEGEGQGAA